MQAYLWVVADVRAALNFASPAWRRAWMVLIPTCLAWALALSPVREAVWTTFALVCTLMASTELYRIATPESAGSRGAVAGRLAIVWLLTLAFFAVLGSLLFVVCLCSAYAVASAGAGFDPADVRTWAPAIDGRGRVVLGVVAVIGTSLLAWAMTRVALAPAATVAAGRVRVLNAWPLTRRIGWRLLAARVAIAGPMLVAGGLALDPSHLGAAGSAPGGWILGALAGVIIGGAWLPLNTGLMAHAFRRQARS
jgi:hypothetical protein